MFYNLKADQPFVHDLHWDGILWVSLPSALLDCLVYTGIKVHCIQGIEQCFGVTSK